MKALFDADLQAAFRAKGNFRSFIPPTRSTRANPSGWPLTTRYRRVFFLFSSPPSLGSISFLFESLLKKKKKEEEKIYRKSSQVGRFLVWRCWTLTWKRCFSQWRRKLKTCSGSSRNCVRLRAAQTPFSIVQVRRLTIKKKGQEFTFFFSLFFSQIHICYTVIIAIYKTKSPIQTIPVIDPFSCF